MAHRAVTYHSYPVSTDLSSYRYCAVELNSDEQLALCEDESSPFMVLENEPDNSKIKDGRVYVGGTCTVKLGGTVSTGNHLVPTTGGVFIAYSKSATYVTDFVYPILIAEQDGVTGDYIEARWISAE